MFKILIFFLATSYAQTVNVPRSPLVLTDVLLTRNFTKDNLSSGGGSIGGFGGGDTTDRRRLAAWFYGQSPIQVCYQLNAFFGLTKQEVDFEIKKSFSIWKNYFIEKQINKNKIQQIDTNFNLKAQCDGGEDLVFYFGTGPINQNLLDLKANQNLSNPVAFANKTHISQDFNWSKGYIRFVENYSYGLDDGFFPDWTNKTHFSEILLHEVGHVVGFAHIPGTIMTGSIVRGTIIENKNLNTVDLENELYQCLDCLAVYNLDSSLDLNLIPTGTKIYFNQDQVKIETQIGIEAIIPNSIIKEEKLSPLISIFESEEIVLKYNHIYFLKYKNYDLTLIRENLSLKVYLKGQVVAIFSRGMGS